MEEWPCTHCGEPLLGAVNRCWKCGGRVQQPVPKPATTATHATTAADILTSVAVGGNSAGEEHAAQPSGGLALALMTRDEMAQATLKEPPRRGSPFAAQVPLSQRVPHETVYGPGPYSANATGSARGVHVSYPPPLTAQYPQNTAAIGGVVVALILGVLSLGMLLFTGFGALLALIGAGAGIWGLRSDRRNLAVVGLLLCCLAIAIGTYQAGFHLYQNLFPGTTVTNPGGGF